VFTYVGLIKLTPEGMEKLEEAPVYLEKIQDIVVEEGGTLEDVWAMMGPYDFITLVKYPDNETAFRALARIAKLDVIHTETFPVEKVDLFFKALV
jgi:uncharacterized protein with GYD domain